jgi:GDPmannose 4,6-dehydratase
MQLMLQQDKPDDCTIATGEARSVGDFVEFVFAVAGLDWRRHVELDCRYFRPTEVDALRDGPTKARGILGWEPADRLRRTGQDDWGTTSTSLDASGP